ncbi:alpha/beta hydrolase [Arenicella xantha]|uniref:TAP-like protein n=1 Tax=Arenicella xantha TaxID=644221 RepID=A0A395JNE8_9GAMM|nr:alpha/beta hydrolase [Arenicella xantha]RBP52823.1 TAP-like protein [Arenicella xantha]
MNKTFFYCAIWLLVLVCSSSTLTTLHAAELAFERCQIKLAAVERDAECASLLRPENPDQPNGRQIELFVAKFPSTAAKPADDAMTFIQGGPGGSSIDMAINYYPIIETILSKRDVIIIDQRGTGRSNELSCPESEIEDTFLAFDPVRAEAELNKCKAALSASDLRYYTTSIAVQDLEAMRIAAGYSQLTVYGVSYGTRVAQHYLRRYPETTRAVILDGVAHIGLNLAGGEIARQSQAALSGVSARCKLDTACEARFGDVLDKFTQLAERLKAQPVSVTIPDPTTAKPVTKTLTEQHLFGVIRMLPYATEGLALLPLLVDHAYQGDYTALAAQYLLIERSMTDGFAMGMQYSVMCAEDYPFVNESDHAGVEDTYMSDAIRKSVEVACKVWPQGTMDEDFRDPFESSVPVLILSGETDPITPPENGERAHTMLANSRHLVVPAHGHGVISRGCVPALARDFVVAANFEDFNPTCIERERAMPFFVDSTGPKP